MHCSSRNIEPPLSSHAVKEGVKRKTKGRASIGVMCSIVVLYSSSGLQGLERDEKSGEKEKNIYSGGGERDDEEEEV